MNNWCFLCCDRNSLPFIAFDVAPSRTTRKFFTIYCAPVFLAIFECSVGASERGKENLCICCICLFSSFAEANLSVFHKMANFFCVSQNGKENLCILCTINKWQRILVHEEFKRVLPLPSIILLELFLCF